jgi:hypothetical protein
VGANQVEGQLHCYAANGTTLNLIKHLVHNFTWYILKLMPIPHVEPKCGEGSDPTEKIFKVRNQSGEINLEGLREIYPTLSLGCFLKKPVTMDYLIERIKAELD